MRSRKPEEARGTGSAPTTRWRRVRRLACALALLPAAAPAQTPAAAPAVQPACRPVPTGPVAPPPTPFDRYGPLFAAVEEARLFPDSKTFADAAPLRDPAAIMASYRAHPPRDANALRAFVQTNFAVPVSSPAPAPSGERPPIGQHIAALWDQLARPPLTVTSGGSALAMPCAYVVPGGRFREMYYWDSYFTMLGLRADGRDALIDGMLADFVSLVERYGHVPNGARSYYVSRSQPPFLYLMMDLSRARDPAVLRRRLAALRREHAYWTTPRREVAMPDGSRLSRYVSDVARPREESWLEDVTLRRTTGRADADLYPALRAGAESGWDFSSRWFADGRTLASIDTADVVPVDLNSLLYGLERAIAAGCAREREGGCAADFTARAAARQAAIERWLWSAAEARYGDWDARRGALRPGLTAATAFPLFTGVASPAHADAAARTIATRLTAPGGLRTTLNRTGQQWDAPNGWAPLQWVAVDGLARTGHPLEAQTVAERFLATVEREYQASGRLLEKYDVEEQRPGGGGEYPTQDGFGWTNGVTRALMERYPTAADPRRN